ncbi:UDP-N-acetylmuramoyl-tripeptide--D-alanyl-D-alanine ligase [Solirhodobacter olei]|uniref:UDP-N-acetylmuramoyl-tripeptide--D-alanyl-D- alanine ligase n=1 Tax=Solirhodobacter olei TaxID=2493082 RepID=UPI000FD99E30|nr:UDP-N-acetylmuramoyl-tripeptide--D-alanyl-D-alanine ligase [Solirhodobacter olei]
MTALWSSEDAVAATGGRATRPFRAFGVSIDTRTLEEGDLFVALTAARDGHDFVAQALEKGAAAALVSRVPEGLGEDAPLLIVPDVLEGLAALGAAGRARTSARVVAVTGSVGKTSTKEMLRDVLSGQGRTHVAEASYNNHWGVPLTLARMPADVDFAVIEIGMNHPGEIAPLARLARPHVAMITNVAAVHLEAFASVEGIAREKASIVTGLEPGGVAVLNADLPVTPILTAAAEAQGAKVVLFGQAEGARFRMRDVQVTRETTVVQAEVAQGTGGVRPVLFKVHSPGRHFAMNALGVLAVAEALGLDPALAATDLGRWQPPQGRGARERIALDILHEDLAFDLIDDAFNASPTSMTAALEVLGAAEPIDGVGRVSEGRRVAILGDMLELGPTELSLHRAIADHPAMAKIAQVHCVGPRMKSLWLALPRRQRGLWFETAAEMAAEARHLVDAGDVVLVKGSKGSKVSLVVDALRKLAQAAQPLSRRTI